MFKLIKNNFKLIFSFFSFLLLAFSFVDGVQAQTFQNSNNSCEEKSLPTGYFISFPYFANQLTCGNFNNDANLGTPNFPDCVALRDIETYKKPETEPLGSLSYLQNTGQHGNNCLNAGGQPQFLPAEVSYNVGFMGNNPSSLYLGSLQAGNLNNDAQGLQDLAWVYSGVDSGNSTPPSVQYLFAQGVGGFGPKNFVPSNALFNNPSFYKGFPSYFAGPYDFDRQLSADKSMTLLDCNEDGLDDAVLLARESYKVDVDLADDLNIMVSVNKNGVLQPVTTNNSLTVLEDGINVIISNMGDSHNPFEANLASGDFDGDGHADLIVVSNHMNTLKAALDNFAVLCRGNGACGFDCTEGNDSNIKKLQFGPDPSVASHSIVSGDFNGDGKLDLVVADTRNSEIDYFFNQGGGLKDWIVKRVETTPPNTDFYYPPVYLTRGRFSTLAVQKGIDEVAASFTRFKEGIDDYGGIIPGLIDFPDDIHIKAYAKTKTILDFKAPEPGPQKANVGEPEIRFFPSDGKGGILSSETLSLNLPKTPKPVAVSVANFDRCGGDDIVTVAWHAIFDGISATSNLHLFLNQNEAPELQSSSTDVAGKPGQSISFEGSCTDPTFDDRSFLFKVLKSPVGAKSSFSVSNVSLSGQENPKISSNFVADTPGEYDVELSCEDFCGAKTVKNIKVLLAEEIPPPDATGASTTGTSTAADSTSGGSVSTSSIAQGGCIASLNGVDTAIPPSALSYGVLIVALSAVLGCRYRLRRSV